MLLSRLSLFNQRNAPIIQQYYDMWHDPCTLLKAISFLLVQMWGSFTDSDILMIILDKPTDKGSYRDTSAV